jgi:hypothetical protein
MIGKFSSFEEWRKAGLHLTRCGLRILTIAALTFVLIGATPADSAQAANYQFNMVIIPSTKYVCENESMTFKVSIEIQLANEPGDTNARFRKVQGSMVNAEVAAGAKSITPSKSFIGDPGTFDPYSVTFTFNAGNAAQTTHLNFSTEISEFWYGNSPVRENCRTQRITKNVDIEIRKCSYKVEMLFMEPMYGFGLLSGIAKEVSLNQFRTQDSDNHFSGITDLNLIYNFKPGLGCPITGQISPVEFYYTGDLVGGRLYLNFSFPSLKATITLTSCGDLPTTTTQSVETHPGSGTVSVSSEGGLATLSTPYWTYMFIVTRVSQ